MKNLKATQRQDISDLINKFELAWTPSAHKAIVEDLDKQKFLQQTCSDIKNSLHDAISSLESSQMESPLHFLFTRTRRLADTVETFLKDGKTEKDFKNVDGITLRESTIALQNLTYQLLATLNDHLIQLKEVLSEVIINPVPTDLSKIDFK